MRIALVGCGWVAGLQIERGLADMSDQFEIVACCDTDPKKAAAFATQHGIPEVATRYGDLLERGDIDAVSICTPRRCIIQWSSTR
jgi:predicted dehydrogenase